MKSGYQFNVKHDHIQIVCDPDFEITKESVMEQWKRLAETCKKTNLRKVLVEACAPKRSMTVAGAQESGSFFEKEGISALSMAFCFTNYETDKLSDFFETVGYNRGIQIKFFNDRTKAIEWLGIDKSELPKA